MAPTETDQAWFMREALKESRLALPGCRPNPPVGCVIVQGQSIVARGFTGAPGKPHAEVAALARLSVAEPENLCVYVTLEPCAFTGRTPPCAAALVRAGIKRVFVGIVDPHPGNRGRGLEMLRSAGIAVEVGILASEIRAFLEPYLFQPECADAGSR